MKLSRRRYLAVLLSLAAVAFVNVGSGVANGAGERGLPACDPAGVGMDAARLAQIPVRMREFIEAKQISGAVTLVARRGCTVHLEAVGQADVAAMKPMRKDSLFAIASMTKPITATAVMILQDEGKLSIDEPAANYIPRLKDVRLDGKPPSGEITIRRLLTHTAGLVGSQRTEKTLEKTVDAIVERPLGYEPGERWQYSPGLSVCGRIIEVVSGQPYDGFLKERIFDPLKMVDTTFQPSEQQRQRLARLYKPSADKKSIEPTSHWLLDDAGQRAPNPSGGLYSTAADISRFYQMILNGGELNGRRVVAKQTVAEMTRVQTGELTTAFTPGNGWGLGWCIVRQPQGVTKMLSPGTCGHGGAFGTQSWLDPKREMIFVLMIQRTGFGNGDASDVRRVFQEMAVQAVRN